MCFFYLLFFLLKTIIQDFIFKLALNLLLRKCGKYFYNDKKQISLDVMKYENLENRSVSIPIQYMVIHLCVSAALWSVFLKLIF